MVFGFTVGNHGRTCMQGHIDMQGFIELTIGKYDDVAGPGEEPSAFALGTQCHLGWTCAYIRAHAHYIDK